MSTEQLYCTLVTLREDTLLLPNAVVAETVGLEKCTPTEGDPGWIMGSLEWGQKLIPVVGFEAFNGAGAPPLLRRTRLVVLHPLQEHPQAMPIALVAQNYPHLITVTPRAITQLPLRPGDRPACVLARVRVGNTEAVIPDLDYLQRQLEGMLPASSSAATAAMELDVSAPGEERPSLVAGMDDPLGLLTPHDDF